MVAAKQMPVEVSISAYAQIYEIYVNLHDADRYIKKSFST